MHTRQDLGRLLELEGLRFGAELGVQRGINTEQILTLWKSCQRFHLVDVWVRY